MLKNGIFVNGTSVLIQKVLAKLSLDSHGASRMDGRKKSGRLIGSFFNVMYLSFAQTVL